MNIASIDFNFFTWQAPPTFIDNFDFDSLFVTWQPPLASWGSLQLDFGRSMEYFPFSPEARYVVPDIARKTENELK